MDLTKHRGTFINCNDMRSALAISYSTLQDNNYQLNEVEQLNFLEYIGNLLYLFKDGFNINNEEYKPTQTLMMAKENLATLLEHLNLELKEFKNDEYVMLIQKNAAVTAVIETIEPELAFSVVQYNHFTLKGNVEKKRKILSSLGKQLEPKRKNLKTINKELEKNIFRMLNNMNIRHNNIDETNKSYYKAKIAHMSSEELEAWYDELYQMILLAFLELDNVERIDKVNTFCNKINC